MNNNHFIINSIFKKVIYFVILPLCILFAGFFIAMSFCPSCSAGMAVTDSGSYTYYAQQLTKMAEEIKAIQEQTVGQFQRLEDIRYQMTGNYGQAQSLLEQLSKIKSLFDEEPSTIEGEGRKWLDLKDKIEGFTGTKTALDKIFQDQRARTTERYTYLNRQYNMRQAALQKSIQRSDELLKQMPDQMKKIEELYARIDKTQNTKEAQDLTNVILLEILKIQSAHVAVITEYNQASALMSFTGLDENVMRQREKEIFKMSSKVNDLPYLKYRGVQKVDTKDMKLNDVW